MSNEASFNWGSLKFGQCQEAIFSPRHTHNGREIRPELKQFIGKRFELEALWLMDDYDRYPGEWALGPFPVVLGGGVSMNGWVASGDMVVLDETQQTKGT